MLNPSLNQLFVYLCVAVITGAPFVFRYWVQSARLPSLEQIDRVVSILTSVIFVALFTGAFVFAPDSRVLGEILLGASILSFSFLYRTRASHLNHTLKTKIKAPALPSQNSTQKLLKILCLAVLALACTRLPLLIPALLIAYPFLTPYFIRFQHPCQKMADSPLKEEIRATFQKAKVKLTEVYLIDSSKTHFTNAFLAKNTLFLTLDLFEKLDEIELNAVIAHEASHLKYHHLPKRIFSGLAYFCMTLFWIAVPTTLLFEGDQIAVGFAAVAAIVCQMFLIGRKVYRQELEADLGAIDLGASSNALISALEKISPSKTEKISPITRLIFGAFHPTAFERKQNILAGVLPAQSIVIPKKSYFVAYSCLIVGYVFYTAQNIDRLNLRSPASLADSAKVSHSEKPIDADKSNERNFQ